MLGLDGASLTLEAVRSVAEGSETVELAPKARRRMEASRAVIQRLVDSDAVVYGVTTGFGPLADIRIGHGQLREIQLNLVRSHAPGVGEPLEDGQVRAMMLIRANVLAKGLSGIRPVVAELLCEMLNRLVHPVVPSRGSVGASGDLSPLAHLALVLIGEGEAHVGGERLSGRDALVRAVLEPLVLEPKEGISLLNGTQGMLAVGSLALLGAEALVEWADAICALTVDALRGTPVAFDARIHEARPHAGQLQSARNLVALLEGGEIRASHFACRCVQDAYSLRCAPQVHGAVRDMLAQGRRASQAPAGRRAYPPSARHRGPRRSPGFGSSGFPPNRAASPGGLPGHPLRLRSGSERSGYFQRHRPRLESVPVSCHMVIGALCTALLYFPPAGEGLEQQIRRPAAEVGLRPAIVEALRGKADRRDLWRWGHLVRVEGDFPHAVEVASLRKTSHALTVGAAIQQGRIPSHDQKLKEWPSDLTGYHAPGDLVARHHPVVGLWLSLRRLLRLPARADLDLFGQESAAPSCRSRRSKRSRPAG